MCWSKINLPTSAILREIIFFNPTYSDIVGLTQREVVLDEILHLLDPSQTPCSLALLFDHRFNALHSHGDRG